MPAYIIFIREGDIFDPAQMQEYVAKAGSVPNDVGLKPLVLYGNLETAEGEAAQGVVLLEFPSLDAAKSWYHSPEYQAALKHRQKAANYRVLIVEGV